MERLLAAIADQNVTGVHLEVAPGNQRAIGFYDTSDSPGSAAIEEASSWGYVCRQVGRTRPIG